MVLSDGGGGSGAVAAAPGGVDPATQAVLLRSKALAQYYDTGAVVTSGTPTIDPATQAVLLRSKGLADYYGANGVTFHTDVLGGNGGASAAPAAAGDSFDWSPVLAATLAGMLLLAAAATMSPGGSTTSATELQLNGGGERAGRKARSSRVQTALARPTRNARIGACRRSASGSCS